MNMNVSPSPHIEKLKRGDKLRVAALAQLRDDIREGLDSRLRAASISKTSIPVQGNPTRRIVTAPQGLT